MKKLIWISALLIVVVIFLSLHSTPKMAVRTHVLFMGYPKEAFTLDIEAYEFNNKADKNNFVMLNVNAKVYSLTKPPFEKATESELSTYIVRRFVFLYFSNYYVDI